MNVLTKYLNLRTKGELDMIDITEYVAKAINGTNIRNGTVTVFVPGSTGALTTIEYEPGLLKDFPEMLERIAPRNIDYEHEKRWHDHNGHSHVRASLIGPSLTIPFKDKKLTLGTWQQVVFIELDIHSRSRELVLQIMGE
ncbi:MAG: YjbQ family protein [archaeon]|nr:YjbQ family protein [archaeon]MCP8313649.1 YjbQ family protein [archaeon]